MTTTGGIATSSGLRSNSAAIICWKATMRLASKFSPPPEYCMPSTTAMMQTMMYDGPVVHIIARMWSKRFEPETAGARFVVSESGDILSPR